MVMNSLPTFVHIGPGRAGTTMLYRAFEEHPEICMAKIKETNYFTFESHRGEDWYRSLFGHCGPAQVIGEVSNLYIYDPQVPARMAELLPEVKLITVLRNPFDRLRSAYLLRKSRGEIDSDISLETAVDRYPDLITDNRYGEQLRRFLRYFPRHNVLIGFFDNLTRDAQEFIGTVFAFLGVDESFVPESIHRRVNRAVDIRHPLLAPVVRWTADSMRRWQLYSLLARTKSSPIIQSLLFKSRPRSSSKELMLSEELKARLREHFVPQIKEVERLTGRNLMSWYDRVA